MCVTLSWRVGPPVGVTATTSLILESGTSNGSANSHLLAMLELHLKKKNANPESAVTFLSVLAIGPVRFVSRASGVA